MKSAPWPQSRRAGNVADFPAKLDHRHQHIINSSVVRDKTTLGPSTVIGISSGRMESGAPERGGFVLNSAPGADVNVGPASI